MTRRALFLGLLSLAFLPSAQAGSAPAPKAPPLREVLRHAEARPGGVYQPAPGGEGPAHSSAPCFVVAGEGSGEAERLPLEETRADVTVAGPIARVTVRQVFRNRGAKPIEAIYVFPASTRAAVHGMRLEIGARVVEAVIQRRAEARATYEAAKAEGKRTALLDEERPNVFTMHVANVMPGDRLVAVLEYSELLVPEQGIYELVYPAVVGPRYAGGAGPGDGWAANPTLHQGEPAPYGFGFAAHLASALPMRDLASPSHPVDVTWRGPRSADVALRGPGGGDRDVILRWRLSGDAVEAGGLVFPDPGGEGGWFMATVEPPARVAPDQLPPREYVFVLDVSGSMHGFPLDTARALMEDLLPRLRPTDRFNLVFFSGGSWVLSPAASLAATPENVRRALDAFRRQEGGGGTELLQALDTAYALPRADRRIARSIVVVTDGYVMVEAQAFRRVRERLGEASCFAFGIGSSVNRALIEGLARAGQGEATVVTSPQGARAAAERLERIISAPVLSQLRWHPEGVEVSDVLPGALPDLLAERPVVLLGRYRGAPRGKIVVEAQSARGPFRQEVDLGAAAATAENAPLRVLWARRWVDLLQDERAMGASHELDEAVTSLGLTYRLLTPLTSFVAVDSEVVNKGGAGEQVKQPLPLPDGVSDRAVGGAGSVNGYLGLAYRRGAPMPMAPAASPPPAPMVAKEAAVAAEPLAQDKADAKASKPAPPVHLSGVQAAHLDDPGALALALTRALAPVAARHPGHAELVLRLTIDASGAVKVELLEGAAGLRAEVEKALAGFRSPARAAGAPSGTYRVRVHFW
ncbi:MAG: VIT domain-containing protein [Anaeromyxobacter sp.]